MCDKTSLRWLTGSIIKQGDSSSVFKIKLSTERDDILNGGAVLQFINLDKKMIEIEAEVIDNVISFQLAKSLPVGQYSIEVEHGGFVFPSTNTINLTVNENVNDFVTVEELELYNVKDIIQKLVIDNINDKDKNEECNQELPDLLTFYNIAKI